MNDMTWFVIWLSAGVWLGMVIARLIDFVTSRR